MLTLNVSKQYKVDIIDRDGSYTVLTSSENLDSFKGAFIELSQDRKYASYIYIYTYIYISGFMKPDLLWLVQMNTRSRITENIPFLSHYRIYITALS
jgi:hypothetical protein